MVVHGSRIVSVTADDPRPRGGVVIGKRYVENVSFLMNWSVVMNMKMNMTGLFAVCAAGLSLTLSAMADAPQASVDEILPVSAVPQTEQDRAAEHLDFDLDRHGLSSESLRWLGTDGLAEYWVAVENKRDVCLLAYIPGDDWVAASTCTSLADFYRSGLGLGLRQDQNDPAQALEAYLLPRDIDPEQLGLSQRADLGAGSLGEFRASLVSVSPLDSELTTAEVTRDNGVVFQFTPLTTDRK